MLNLNLVDYVNKGIMTIDQKNEIEASLLDRKNILIVGGIGSGKTTLCNALLKYLASTGQRIIVLQDIEELVVSSDNVVSLNYNQSKASLQSILKFRPDRIIIGEIRDAIVLKVWATGYPGGIATICGSSGENVLDSFAYIGDTKLSKGFIAETIDLVIEIRRDNNDSFSIELSTVQVGGNKETN